MPDDKGRLELTRIRNDKYLKTSLEEYKNIIEQLNFKQGKKDNVYRMKIGHLITDIEFNMTDRKNLMWKARFVDTDKETTEEASGTLKAKLIEFIIYCLRPYLPDLNVDVLKGL